MHRCPSRPLPTTSLTTLTTPTTLTSLLLLLVLASQLLLLPMPVARAAEPVVATPAIVPFDDWAPAACPRPTGAEPAPTQRVVVHHTHEPVAHTSAEVLPALALTCKAHTDRGFSTIGYHYVVDPWGAIYQGRGALPDDQGRAPKTQAKGAHVAGTNAGAVGVVFLGDHEDEPPTTAALESATHLLAWLLERTGNGPADYVSVVSTGLGTANFKGRAPLPALAGHSDSNHTACPGEHLRALLPEMRDRVLQHLLGRQPVSWAGLAADLPEEPPAPEPAPAPAPEAPATDAEAPAQDETALVDVAAAAVPLGPLVSPVEVLARSLREVGLLSLAERITAPLRG